MHRARGRGGRRRSLSGAWPSTGGRLRALRQAECRVRSDLCLLVSEVSLWAWLLIPVPGALGHQQHLPSGSGAPQQGEGGLSRAGRKGVLKRVLLGFYRLVQRGGPEVCRVLWRRWTLTCLPGEHVEEGAVHVGGTLGGGKAWGLEAPLSILRDMPRALT